MRVYVRTREAIRLNIMFNHSVLEVHDLARQMAPLRKRPKNAPRNAPRVLPLVVRPKCADSRDSGIFADFCRLAILRQLTGCFCGRQMAGK